MNCTFYSIASFWNFLDEPIKDGALKYLSVLVDSAKLYTEALATYDLQLTLMVAQRSQMVLLFLFSTHAYSTPVIFDDFQDPKEYLPFLNELDAVTDVHFRRFSIDNSLKRYDSAVRHLCHCRPVRTKEIVSYMKLHRIYTPVIDEFCLIPTEDVKDALETAACWQADTLTARNSHEEAGYIYQRVGLYQKALSSFQECGLWRNCVSLSSLISMG